MTEKYKVDKLLMVVFIDEDTVNMRRTGLPPRGGSGLKYHHERGRLASFLSPSARRETDVFRGAGIDV